MFRLSDDSILKIIEMATILFDYDFFSKILQVSSRVTSMLVRDDALLARTLMARTPTTSDLILKVSTDSPRSAESALSVRIVERALLASSFPKDSMRKVCERGSYDVLALLLQRSCKGDDDDDDLLMPAIDNCRSDIAELVVTESQKNGLQIIRARHVVASIDMNDPDTLEMLLRHAPGLVDVTVESATVMHQLDLISDLIRRGSVQADVAEFNVGAVLGNAIINAESECYHGHELIREIISHDFGHGIDVRRGAIRSREFLADSLVLRAIWFGALPQDPVRACRPGPASSNLMLSIEPPMTV